MTGAIISGPGLGLQLPQNLYPSELLNAPYDWGTNRISLAAGDAIPVPRGTWIIGLGMYSILQYLDPVTSTWSTGPTAGWTGGWQIVQSDGFNVRVANLLGCPIGAEVAALGSSYVQASTTVTPTPGNSTWSPIIGGALALSGGTINSTTAGAGYGVAPLVPFNAPPPAIVNANGVGGIAASGWVSISSGTVNGFTFTNPGAGYTTAPTLVLLPNPTDPNITTGITAATLAFTLTNSGALTGAVCTNSGAPLANPANITLTIAGAGSGASLTANVLQTVTAVSVTGAAGGYGTVTALATTVGGVPVAGSIAGPSSIGIAWRPRPLQAALTVTGAGSLAPQVGTIYDGGLFLQAPTAVVAINPLATTGTLNTPGLALTMGNRSDIIVMQPLG